MLSHRIVALFLAVTLPLMQVHPDKVKPDAPIRQRVLAQKIFAVLSEKFNGERQ